MMHVVTVITECPALCQMSNEAVNVADFVPNTSDDEGRYRIGAQADVGLFNLEKLSASLDPVLSTKQQKE